MVQGEELHMIVTQHARFTAMSQVLWDNQILEINDEILFSQLETDWLQLTGLRRSDLILTLDELIRNSGILQSTSGSGVAIELQDRGVLIMQRFNRPFVDYRWTSPISSLWHQFNTAHVLASARRRFHRRWAIAARYFPPENCRRQMI